MLLRNKRLKDLNKGKYVGIGGHIEKGETKEEALIREVNEETGITLTNYTYRGKVLFSNGNYKELMYLFHAETNEDISKDCDEGTLYWINKKDIFNLNLWEGDIYFLKPLLETNDVINLNLIYEGEKLIKYEYYETK